MLSRTGRGPVRVKPSKLSSRCAKLSRGEGGWVGLGWVGLGWVGLVKLGVVWFGLVWSGVWFSGAARWGGR